jgi:hypothetical protein
MSRRRSDQRSVSTAVLRCIQKCIELPTRAKLLVPPKYFEHSDILILPSSYTLRFTHLMTFQNLFMGNGAPGLTSSLVHIRRSVPRFSGSQ